MRLSLTIYFCIYELSATSLQPSTVHTQLVYIFNQRTSNLFHYNSMVQVCQDGGYCTVSFYHSYFNSCAANHYRVKTRNEVTLYVRIKGNTAGQTHGEDGAYIAPIVKTRDNQRQHTKTILNRILA